MKPLHVHRVKIANRTSSPIDVQVEPWAALIAMPPGEQFELVAETSDRKAETDISIDVSHISVLFAHATEFFVVHDGERIPMADLEFGSWIRAR